MTELLRRRDADGSVRITPAEAGWQYIQFEATHLKAGAVRHGETADNETALIILGGRCTVRLGDQAAGGLAFEGIGDRPDVWGKTPAYAVLLPAATVYSVEALTDLHLALAAAPAIRKTTSSGRSMRPATSLFRIARCWRLALRGDIRWR